MRYKPYQDAINLAVQRAASTSETMYVYRRGDSYFVRGRDDKKLPAVRLLCIVQRWGDKLVQVKFTADQMDEYAQL
jgi:hypothetical protein